MPHSWVNVGAYQIWNPGCLLSVTFVSEDKVDEISIVCLKRTNANNQGGVSLHLASSPMSFRGNLFSRMELAHPDFMAHSVLEIRWRLRIGDAKPSSNF